MAERTPHDLPDVSVYETVVRYLDGQLTAEEMVRFEEGLANDPTNRTAMLDVCLQMAMITESSQGCVLSLLQSDETVEEFCTDDGFPPTARDQSPLLPPTAFSGFYGSLSSLASGWPAAYLIATMITGVGLLALAFTHISRPVEVANIERPIENRETSPACSTERPIVARITCMDDCQWGGRGEGRGERGERLVCNAEQRSAVSGGSSSTRHSPLATNHSPLATRHLVRLGDKFALRSGLLEITYDSGARVILQGPVSYEVESATGGHLAAGKLTARVESSTKYGVRSTEHGLADRVESNPQSLIPNPSPVTSHQPLATSHTSCPSPLSPLPSPLFAITTPTAIVTDLGTEFCVEVHEDRSSDVFVRSGKVELAAGKNGPRQLLQAHSGQNVPNAARVEPRGERGDLQIVSVAPDWGRFEKMVSRLEASKQPNHRGDRVLVQSRFNLSSEGWTATPTSTGANYSRDWGNPGGCIHTRQNTRDNFTFYYIASPMFFGDRSAAFGGQLKFDVFAAFVKPDEPVPEKLFWMEQPLVILEGPKTCIAADLPAPFAREQWTTLSVPLDSRGKWYRFVRNRDSLEGKTTDRTPVSDAVIREVLSDLRDLWIRAEYLHGEDGGRLDNVLLLAPGSPVSNNQKTDATGSVLESGKGGAHAPDAALEIQVKSGAQ